MVSLSMTIGSRRSDVTGYRLALSAQSCTIESSRLRVSVQAGGHRVGVPAELPSVEMKHVQHNLRIALLVFLGDGRRCEQFGPLRGKTLHGQHHGQMGSHRESPRNRVKANVYLVHEVGWLANPH